MCIYYLLLLAFYRDDEKRENVSKYLESKEPFTFSASSVV